MSSASSAVTYTSVDTDSEPGRVFWRADEELSNGGSLRVIVYRYDGLPMLPVAPPSPDYIPGPEEPLISPAPQDVDEHELMFMQPHDPDLVPEPIYPEYIPLEDEHILSVREEPLPPIVSPTAESSGYVAESNLEEDPEEYEDDETEDGPVDHPMDEGDDGDDDDGDSSGYDADDEDNDEENEEEEEEEHLAPADSTVVIPIDELASPPEGTEPIIPPPSTDTATTGARITIRLQTFISLLPEAEVERLLAMPTPSPSPLTSLSPPSVEERQARCTAPYALPLPPLPPSLYPLPPVDHRDDIPESEQPHRKRLCLSILGSREVGYGIRDTWIDPAEAVPEMAPTTLEKVYTRVTELAELHKHDTQDLYALLEDAHDEEEAYTAREAWAHSVGLSQTVHHELQTLLKQVYAREYQLQTHQTQLQLQITDNRDSSSNERHETRDGRHAGRVVSTTWAADESWIARRGLKKFPLPEYFPTASEERFSLLSKRDAPAKEVCTADEGTILKTFGRNEATKKTKKNQLKRQYGNFKAEGSETLEQTFNRLQAIVSHMEFMDVEIEQDNLNQKLLTSLAPEWFMYTILWRNRSDLDTMTKNNNGKGEVNTASIPTASTQVSPIKYEDINQNDEDDIEEVDIKAPRSQDRGRRESYKQGSKVEELAPKALMAINGVGWDWSYMDNEEENHDLVANEEALTEFALMAKSSSSFENEVFDNSLCSKACKKNTDSLNTKITELSKKLSDTKTNLYQVYSSPKKDMS
uniref:Uncharacterized protein n=1 Tax=Tanacetum cinerariifolium TaxID=118510 RepID=A0A699IQ93_TANCI|nr:hypothetical protein [Tanacetum cinerariifolium]